jgi:beta-glucosidase-like glycosyl hydrolase
MIPPMRREVAQLLIPVIDWESGAGFASALPAIEAAIAEGVGGFLFTGGEQDAVRALAKSLQLRSRHPLLLGAVLERGAGQRFGSATGLPPIAAIVALDDMEALRRAARLTAREARTMGVNWNLAPVADLDLGDGNPILGAGAMGSAPRDVSTRVAAWIEACQAEGVLACVKHFPGIGRLRSDPHVGPARVDTAADVLKEQDLAPFRAAIGAGVASMMTAHVAYPALDTSGVPASRSREMLQWLLRQQLRYDNLIVSDRLGVRGLHHDIGECAAAVEALRAGCDLLLAPSDLGATLDALAAATADGTLDPDRIRQSVRRRLKWAQWASPPNEWRRPSGADTAWGALLADRVLHVANGPLPTLGAITEVAVVDDDESVPGDARVPRTVIAEALRLSRIDARVVDAPSVIGGGPLVIALFCDDLPHKERTAPSDGTLATVRELIAAAAARQRAAVLVVFGAPRRAEQVQAALTAPVPVLTAWGEDRVMQQAAARLLARPARG